MVKYFYMLFVLFITMFLFAADVSRVINYQGKLFDGDGPASGSYNIGYKLYTVETGGTACWEQTAHSITVTNGLFSDTLGVHIDITLSANEVLWLAIVIEGTELSPRERLWAAPYALTVPNKAITSEKLADGTSAGQVLEWSGTTWQLAPNESNGELKSSSSNLKLFRPYHSW
ncbi:hypothetical protein J7L68_07180 [bacterium]|nr:hypothetical protein [bacterium]